MKDDIITMETSIPKDEVWLFIWKDGFSIKLSTESLGLDRIGLEYNDENRPKIDDEWDRNITVTGYPTNVYQAVSNIRNNFYDLLKWDILLAREFEIVDWEIIVELPKWLKGVVKNSRDIVKHKIRTALKHIGDNYYLSSKEDVKVVDIKMLEWSHFNIDDFIESEKDEELGEFAEKLLKATWLEFEEKPKKREGYLDVEILQQVTQTVVLDNAQIWHFIWKKWKNKKFLEDKFNVIIKKISKQVEITGSHACVSKARFEINKTYRNTIFYAEILCSNRDWTQVKLENGDKYWIDVCWNECSKWQKIKVILFNKGLSRERVKLYKKNDYKKAT